jgi:phospholipid transport system substrate-binding protein
MARSARTALRLLQGIGGGAALVLLMAGGAPAVAPESPTEVVKATINEVIRILSDESMKQPERLKERRKLLEDVIGRRFDYEEMSKRSLASHWKNLSEADRQEFVEVFRAFLSHTYGGKIEGYSGEQVHYLQERLEGAYAEVRTKIVSEKVSLPMDYRLISKADDWRVYDVVADGISLVRNYRGQFDKIIRESSYADLVEKLRKKSEDIKPPKSKTRSKTAAEAERSAMIGGRLVRGV